MTEPIKVDAGKGMRKLVAFSVTIFALLVVACLALFNVADGATLGDVLASVGSSMTLALLYFTGGNVGEHVAKRPPK